MSALYIMAGVVLQQLLLSLTKDLWLLIDAVLIAVDSNTQVDFGGACISVSTLLQIEHGVLGPIFNALEHGAGR